MGLKDRIVRIGAGEDAKRSGRLILLLGPSGVGKTHQLSTLVKGGMRVLVASSEKKMKSAESQLIVAGKSVDVLPIQNLDFPEHPSLYKGGTSDLFDLLLWAKIAKKREDFPYDAIFFDSFMRYLWKLLQELFQTTLTKDLKQDKLRAYGIFAEKTQALLDGIASVTDASVCKNPIHFIGTWGTGVDVHPETGRKTTLPVAAGKVVQKVVNFYWDDVLNMTVDDTGWYFNIVGGKDFDAKVSSAFYDLKKTKRIEADLFKFIQMAEGQDATSTS